MKKRFSVLIAVVIICITSLVNLYVSQKHGVPLSQYIKLSMPMTDEEKQTLKDCRTVKYGVDKTSVPLNYLDNESNQYKGIVVDYINALSMEIGIDFNLKPVPENFGEEDLVNSDIDVIKTYKTLRPLKGVIYSNPLYMLRGVMVTKSNTPEINTINNLENKTVAIREGDYSEEFLKRRKINANIVKVNSVLEAIDMVKRGQADVAIGDEPICAMLLKEYEEMSNLKITGEAIYEKQIVLAIDKEYKELLPLINKGILKLKKNNFIGKLEQKWLGISNYDDYDLYGKLRIIYGILIFIIIILAIIYSSNLVNYSLKKKIDKKTEELKRSKEELQAAFDVLDKLVIVVDKQGTIVNANKDFCELIKIEREKILNTKVYDLNSVSKSIWYTTRLGDKEEMNFELNINKKYYSILYRNINKNDVNSDKIIFIKNITQDKIAENQLLQSHKMAAVGQLAAGVAHEIRNPLGLIRNYSYLLKNKKINEETYNKCIDNIDASVERASKIIDNLLNFSSISGNQNKLLNIKEFFENILQLENKNLQQKSIEVSLTCPNLNVNTNEESFKHIFINLLTNAIDAMEQGGKIDIKCYYESEFVQVYVTDTGKGIEEEDINDIFNPFFTKKDPGKGTGLGLFIVYNEVKKLGGNINVEKSKLNKGTTFKVEIPMKGEIV